MNRTLISLSHFAAHLNRWLAVPAALMALTVLVLIFLPPSCGASLPKQSPLLTIVGWAHREEKLDEGLFVAHYTDKGMIDIGPSLVDYWAANRSSCGCRITRIAYQQRSTDLSALERRWYITVEPSATPATQEVLLTPLDVIAWGTGGLDAAFAHAASVHKPGSTVVAAAVLEWSKPYRGRPYPQLSAIVVEDAKQ